MSMTWWNWLRSSPFALMPLGQWTTSGLRVPPKWLATCLVHWNGVSIAHAQATGTCGSVLRPADQIDPLDDVGQSGAEPGQAGDLVERAFQPALGAGPVVPGDVEDQRVVQLPACSRLSIRRPIWSSA